MATSTEAVDVVRQGAGRAQRQHRGEPAGDHGGQLLVAHPDRRRAQCPGVGDQAGAVAVAQQRPAVRAGPACEPSGSRSSSTGTRTAAWSRSRLAASASSFAGGVIFEPAAAIGSPLGGDAGEVLEQARAALAAGRPGKAMAIFSRGASGLPPWQASLVGLAAAVVPRYRRLVPCQLDSLDALNQLGVRLDTYAMIEVPTVLLSGRSRGRPTPDAGRAAHPGGSATLARYSGRCSCASASRAVEVSEARRTRLASSWAVKSPASRSEAWMNP
jgi:hypothetical protein